MKIVMFYPSLNKVSTDCTGIFISGLLKAFISRGHEAQLVLPESNDPDAESKIDDLLKPYIFWYRDLKELKLNRILSGASVVLVQETNEPALIARIGKHRSKRSGSYSLFFHDTSFKALKNTDILGKEFSLEHYDAVLAGCDMLRNMYLQKGITSQAWTWEMTVDTTVFYPKRNTTCDGDLVWIGNWGDEVKSSSLEEFLLKPVKELGLKAKVYGSRYPQHAINLLQDAGISYGGYLPYHRFPEVFSKYKATVHIPDQPAGEQVKAKPAFRVFEALSCGIPLIASSWSQHDSMFTPGKELLLAHSGEEMKKHLKEILSDSRRARDLVSNGLRTINRHYSCSHRAAELENLVYQLKQQNTESGSGQINTYAS